MSQPAPGVARLHAAIAAACLAEPEAALTDLRALLVRHGVEAEDVEALLASPRRLGLYRQLVRHNVFNVSTAMLDRTRARIESRAPGAWGATFDAFLREAGPKTPHLRDVPSELLAFAAPRWRTDARLPRWIVDYAELELIDFTVGVAPRPSPPPPLAEVAPDRPLVFADPHALVRLGWAVHEVDAGDVSAEPVERPTTLLVYRDAAHRTRFLDLTPAAAEILARLLAGATLAVAMTEAAAATGAALDADLLGGAARLLADLGERGVLLGGRASS